MSGHILLMLGGCKGNFQNDGIVYLGVPTAEDKLYWNAVHVYGPIRLPMMTANWEVIYMSYPMLERLTE